MCIKTIQQDIAHAPPAPDYIEIDSLGQFRKAMNMSEMRVPSRKDKPCERVCPTRPEPLDY